MGSAADKTGDIMIIMSAQLSLLLDFKCQFLIFGVLFYISGLYVIIIIITIITRGVSVYFTYCGREKINFDWVLKKQLVKQKIAISKWGVQPGIETPVSVIRGKFVDSVTISFTIQICSHPKMLVNVAKIEQFGTIQTLRIALLLPV
jgi:hypothetical protein